MDVRIGVTYSPKELDLELPDDTAPETVRADVEAALAGGDDRVLWLTDRRGRQVGVPVAKIAYTNEWFTRDFRIRWSGKPVAAATAAPSADRQALPFARHHAFIVGIDAYEKVAPSRPPSATRGRWRRCWPTSSTSTCTSPC